ncbi:hypothetical protein CH063_13887 [Colletotrichum higginsianum]|uniref:Uncharacterized protein n=1 Tax=Colletotrichum higginsianum (strain IMI 349063) TaxID=759273 RepID=H1VWA6_COLHI|nr:hypothetical protein CH063_13887 [Colletotrichum higginsianum]
MRQTLTSQHNTGGPGLLSPPLVDGSLTHGKEGRHRGRASMDMSRYCNHLFQVPLLLTSSSSSSSSSPSSHVQDVLRGRRVLLSLTSSEGAQCPRG